MVPCRLASQCHPLNDSIGCRNSSIAAFFLLVRRLSTTNHFNHKTQCGVQNAIPSVEFLVSVRTDSKSFLRNSFSWWSFRLMKSLCSSFTGMIHLWFSTLLGPSSIFYFAEQNRSNSSKQILSIWHQMPKNRENKLSWVWICARPGCPGLPFQWRGSLLTVTGKR